MSGLEVWLRVTAVVFAAVVIGALSPAGGVSPSFLTSATIEELATGLHWQTDAGYLFSLRAYFLFDFLFLSAHGWLFHRLLKGKRAALVMMAADAVENVAALFLMDAVLRGHTGGSAWLPIYAVAFWGKWVAVAWTYFGCLRVAAPGRSLWLRRIGLGAAAIAGLVYPVVFRWSGSGAQDAVGLVLFGGLGMFLLLTGLGTAQSGTHFRSLFFMRAQLTALAVLAVSAAVAFGPLRAFLFAILHFYNTDSGLGGFFFTATVAYFLALLVPVQARIVLVHGVDRFGMPALTKPELRQILQLLQNSLLAAVTVLIVAGVTVTWGPLAWEHLLGVAGLVTAAALFAAADRIAGQVTAKPLDLPLLLLPGKLGAWWESWLSPLAAKEVPGLVTRISEWIARQQIFRPRGYFDVDGYLLPEHACGLGLFVMAALLFGGVMVWVLGFQSPPPQSLASLCLLGIVITGATAGITFFFDRYGVPAFLVLILLRAAAGIPSGMDNVFEAAPDKGVAYRSPGNVLRQFAEREAILVAASGGGIQAAGWMTHVLHKLDMEARIRPRIALISGVSGGAVGAYHLGGEWKEPDWGKMEAAAQLSSLGPLTTALLGPDLFRPLLAWSKKGLHLDRGFALEYTIQQHHVMATGQAADFTMDEWAAEAGRDRPAMLFNSTVVETGAPVAFATTELPSGEYTRRVHNPMGVGHPVESWQSLHKRCWEGRAPRNLKVATAARMSATFPYVSPAARLEADGPCSLHFVDGGYYDNYGLVGLLQWLDDALEELRRNHEPLPSSIRILVIRGLNLPEAAAEGGARRADQLLAPAEAFLNMRTYAQWRGAAVAMRLFIDKWQETAKFAETVQISYPDLRKAVPACSEEPLTWKLTPSQQDCLAVGWEHLTASNPALLEAFKGR